MPDSYGRPLCSSPRLRWEINQAAPIVRKTNETPAKANPTTYQIWVTRTPFGDATRGGRRLRDDPMQETCPHPDGTNRPLVNSISGSGLGDAPAPPPKAPASGRGVVRAERACRSAHHSLQVVPDPWRIVPPRIHRQQ